MNRKAGLLGWVTEHNAKHNNEYCDFVFTNKYLAVLRPDHHCARKDGYVYIHQLQAERLLGRNIRNEECVHHKDGNKYNNSLNNLLVFKTNSDHISFHRGCDIVQDNDVWVALPHKNSACPICGAAKDFKASVCISCFKQHKSAQIPTKDQLLDLLVTLRSLTPISKLYGVSTTAVKKWCVKYDLPYKRSDLKSLPNATWLLH